MAEGNLVPLHLLIGINYLKPLLALSPTGLWMVLDTNSQDMKWGMEIILDLPFGFPINNIISLGNGGA